MQVESAKDPLVSTVGSQARPGVDKPQQDAVAHPEPPQFISPVIRVDTAGIVMLQYRDGNTGEVEVQIPRESAVKAYHSGGGEAAALVAGQVGQVAQQPTASAQPTVNTGVEKAAAQPAIAAPGASGGSAKA